MKYIVVFFVSFCEEWFLFCCFVYLFGKNRDDDKIIKIELFVFGKDGI